MAAAVGVGNAPPDTGVVGGETQTGITTGASTTLLGPSGAPGSQRLYAAVVSDQTFNLYLMMTGDGGTNWRIYKKIASAANDDGTYTQSAEVDQYIPSNVRLDFKNTSGSTSAALYDARFFNTNQS